MYFVRNRQLGYQYLTVYAPSMIIFGKQHRSPAYSNREKNQGPHPTQMIPRLSPVRLLKKKIEMCLEALSLYWGLSLSHVARIERKLSRKSHGRAETERIPVQGRIEQLSHTRIILTLGRSAMICRICCLLAGWRTRLCL